MEKKGQSTKYKNNFDRENYDRISVNVAKGQREIIKAYAESHGESINAFIARAIREQMKRDQSATTNPADNY